MVIEQQARELTQLRQLLKEGRDGSFLLKEHLKALLTQDNLDNCQGQCLSEHLLEGRRLAEHLARTLSPGKVSTALMTLSSSQVPAHRTLQSPSGSLVSTSRLWP